MASSKTIPAHLAGERARVKDLWGQSGVKERLELLTEEAKYDRTGKRCYRGNRGAARAEVRILTDNVGRQGMRGGRNVSYKTCSDRKNACYGFVDTLHERGFQVRKLKNLDRKHIFVLISSWVEAGHAAATIATKTSILKWLYQALGKGYLVQNMDEYFADPSVRRRPQRAESDKSLQSAGITFEEIYRRAAALSELFAAQLALSYWFSMRPQESWLWRPHQNFDAETRTLEIRFGTKGGRPRLYPTRLSDQEVAVVEAARRLVPHMSGSMIPSELTKKEWNSKYYPWCEKIGLTKADLGVTAYCLRHSRAHTEWSGITGVDVPVRAGDQNVDAETLELANQRTAELLGHARPQISAHYTG
jgi:integrase